MFYWLDSFTRSSSIKAWFRNPSPAPFFLTFYADLIKWVDESCGPRASGPAAVWPYIGVQRINLK
jgi:hypothetical protein